MICFEIYFNYKKEYHRAWIFCTVIIVFAGILVAAALYNYTSYYEGSHTTLDAIEFVGASLIEIWMPTAPSISYIILLNSLRKRFSVLNSLLR